MKYYWKTKSIWKAKYKWKVKWKAKEKWNQTAFEIKTKIRYKVESQVYFIVWQLSANHVAEGCH